jgi:hypothetical protein
LLEPNRELLHRHRLVAPVQRTEQRVPVLLEKLADVGARLQDSASEWAEAPAFPKTGLAIREP